MKTNCLVCAHIRQALKQDTYTLTRTLVYFCQISQKHGNKTSVLVQYLCRAWF
jgi:hypothetical protein